jgi:hypothetical protein
VRHVDFHHLPIVRPRRPRRSNRSRQKRSLSKCKETFTVLPAFSIEDDPQPEVRVIRKGQVPMVIEAEVIEPSRRRPRVPGGGKEWLEQFRLCDCQG